MTDNEQPAPDPRERTEEQMYAQFLGQTITGIAAKLRRMADSVEHQGQQVARVGGPGRPGYASLAAEVQHDLLWGFVNLHLDRLVQEAGDADIARKTGA